MVILSRVQTTWKSIYRFKYINWQAIGYYHISHLLQVKFVKMQQINLYCLCFWRDTHLIMNLFVYDQTSSTQPTIQYEPHWLGEIITVPLEVVVVVYMAGGSSRQVNSILPIPHLENANNLLSHVSVRPAHVPLIIQDAFLEVLPSKNRYGNMQVNIACAPNRLPFVTTSERAIVAGASQITTTKLKEISLLSFLLILVCFHAL